jgi:hypothetical protein
MIIFTPSPPHCLRQGDMFAVSGFGYLILLRRIEPMKMHPSVAERAIVATE